MNFKAKANLPKNKIVIKADDHAKNKENYRHLQDRLSNYEMKYAKRKHDDGRKRITGMPQLFRYTRAAVLYISAVAITMVLLFGSVSAFNMCLGSEVFVDGHNIGLVTDKQAFEDLLVTVGKEVDATIGNGEGVIKKADYIPRIVSERDITPEYQLKQNLLSTYNDMVTAYSIYYGDQFLAATLDNEAAQGALEEIKKMYVQQASPGAEVSFAQDVSVREEVVPVGMVRSAENIKNSLLNASETGEKFHVVQNNETLWGIAAQYGTTVDDIINLNEGNVSDIIHDGDKILVSKAKPILTVKSTYVEEVEQEIPYDIEQIQDSTMDEGKTEIVTAGVMGKKMVKQEVAKENNQVLESNLIAETVLSNPQKQVVKVGTKPVPKEGVSSGKFSRPVYGTLTSRFGRRSRGYHTGIDWAVPTGTSVLAADGGTVTKAGWYGGYGNLVVVSHGNGYETYYGHCSSLNVTVGQKVSKGQLLAKSGSTGNSTGPHLHFEVRQNGVPQNPESYVK